MGCCLLAAIVIGRWIAIGDGARYHLGRARAWALRRPAPARPGSGLGAAPRRPFRLGRRARLFVAMELVMLGLLALHEFGPGTHLAHLGGMLHALHMPAVFAESTQELGLICTTLQRDGGPGLLTLAPSRDAAASRVQPQ